MISTEKNWEILEELEKNLRVNFEKVLEHREESKKFQKN